ncbi:MAG: tetratricopeptide repeat protein [Sandaracinaceae bacterium]|nr:tetratricopeptide repeat protein [Sandaracinaceae bacterium]
MRSARQRSLAAACGAALLALATAQGASAQREEEAPDAPAIEQARALFAEGVAHASAERWARAIDAFERALALRSAPAILYNLAAALVESGRYRDAHGHLLALEADAETAEMPAPLAALARELRARMDREAGRLRIARAPAVRDAEVVLDTVPVPEAQLATALPVTPGEHTVVATRGARLIATVTVHASAGALTEVTLAAEEEPAPVIVRAETPLVEEPLFWAAVAAGVLVLAGVVVLAAALAAEPSQAPVAGDFSPAILTWP